MGFCLTMIMMMPLPPHFAKNIIMITMTYIIKASYWRVVPYTQTVRVPSL